MRQLALIIQKRRRIYVWTANAKQKRDLFLTNSPSTFNLFRVHTKQCSRETPVVRLKSLLLCFRRAFSFSKEFVSCQNFSFHLLTFEILFLLRNDECHLNVIMSGYPNMNLKFASISLRVSPSNPICVMRNCVVTVDALTWQKDFTIAGAWERFRLLITAWQPKGLQLTSGWVNSD